MSATNFSMIWAQLASPYQSSGMIPFVDTDNASITGDVLNFFYNQATKNLTVAEGVSVNWQGNQVPFPSPQTQKHISGASQIAIGTLAMVINNALIKDSNTIVLINPLNIDATLLRWKVVCTPGQMTITGNANATANWQFNYLIINVTAAT